MTLVAISILNFNSTESSIRCVKSLLSAEKNARNQYQLQIRLIDNGSAPNNFGSLQKAFAHNCNVHLHRNNENRGFAAGHNQNLQKIFTSMNPDFVWLLNNDCLVDSETLLALLRCAVRQPEIGIWGATLIERDGKNIQCAGGCIYNSWISSYREHGNGMHLEYLDKVNKIQFDYLAGASLFFPLATLQQGLLTIPERSTGTGQDRGQWLNEDFFLYFEELDLAKRLHSNLGMGWCRNAIIRHIGGKSSGTQGKQRTEDAEYHSSLSALKFTRLYYPNRLWLMALIRFSSKSLMLILRGKASLIRPMAQAYQDYWGFLKKTGR